MTMAVRNLTIFMMELGEDVIRKTLSVNYNFIHPFKNINIPLYNIIFMFLIWV
jgi:hypothetical protein